MTAVVISCKMMSVMLTAL